MEIHSQSSWTSRTPEYAFRKYVLNTKSFLINWLTSWTASKMTRGDGDYLVEMKFLQSKGH